MCLAFMLVVMAKLCYLHLGQHNKVTHEYQRIIEGCRGRIFDRNGDGHPMVTTIRARRFFLDPGIVSTNHSVTAIASCIATNLNLDYNEVLGKFSYRDKRWRDQELAVSDSKEAYENLVLSPDVSGVRAQEVTLRKYPYGSSMAHVLGYLHGGGTGGAGIECSYNEDLRPTSGLLESERDGRRRLREINVKRKISAPAIDGNDVYLTLDHTIQHEVECELQAVVEKFDALRGWVIVERVKTGEILSMAVYPSYEPENYRQYEEPQRQNLAIGFCYEPGSVMKAFTVAAYLNENCGSPNTLFDTYDGRWSFGGAVLRDHVSGMITTATALKKSSNIACGKMGLALGARRLYTYLRAFNFGSKIGVELPGEASGILNRPDKWAKITPTRVAIGQSVSVSGLQLVAGYSALANGGVMMRPYFVDKVVAANGDLIKQNHPTVMGRPVRPEVARKVCEMLRGVTEPDGTGRRAIVKGYSVAGKTGTAQKLVRSDPTNPKSKLIYSNTDYFSSFIGFFPATKPEYTILVSIDRPRPQHSGAYVAAPLFSRIVELVARHMEVQPDRPQEIEESERAVTASYR